MSKDLHLFDVVALLTDMPDRKLRQGQVGTIVEQLADGVYEVEFATKQGQTITTCAVEAENLLLLRHELSL